jgi:hypothetical protein
VGSAQTGQRIVSRYGMAASHGSHHKPFELMLPHSTQGCDGKSRRSFAAMLNVGSLKIDKILSFQGACAS